MIHTSSIKHADHEIPVGLSGLHFNVVFTRMIFSDFLSNNSISRHDFKADLS